MFKIEFILSVLIALATLLIAFSRYAQNNILILYCSIVVFVLSVCFIIYNEKKPKKEKPLKKGDFDDRINSTDEKIDSLKEDCIEKLYDYHDTVAEKEKLKKEKKALEERLAKRGERDDLYKQAKERVAVCDWDSAEALLKKAYEKDTKRKAEDAFELGNVNYFKPDYKKAEKYYEEAVRLDPDNALYLGNLGELLYHTADYKKSIEYSERALEIDKKAFGEQHPNVAIRLNNIGMAWQSLGQNKKAIEYFEKALKIFEDMLGPEHPYTKGVRDNIEIAKMKL
jgi:tetratricopeptide (TPR) repeat protein